MAPPRDRQLQKQVDDLERNARAQPEERVADWFESCDIGGTEWDSIGVADSEIILHPVHIMIPTRVLSVTFVARSTPPPAAGPKIAAAFYRMVRPTAASGRTLGPSPSVSRFGLMESIGSFGLDAGGGISNGEAFDRLLPSEVLLRPEQGIYLATKVLDFANTEALTRQGEMLGPNMSFRAVATDSTAGASTWPSELLLDRSTRRRMVYFALRSAHGLRLFGDGLEQ